MTSSGLKITGLDHLVLTVADMDRSVRFYESVLGMRVARFGKGRVALHFGRQKINLHEHGREIPPHADHPMPGSADLCLITETGLDTAMAHVRNQGVDIIAGPVKRTGAAGRMASFYFRDPDGNLIEVSYYDRTP